MYRRIHLIAVVLALGALSSCPGCGGDKANMAEVKGKVTLDGQPLTIGAVNFIPEVSKAATGPAAPMSAGAISPQGEFTLMGANGQKGAAVGFHKITVHPPLVGGSSPTGEKPAAAAPTVKIPPKYSNILTTDLTQEIKKGVVNEFTLELKSK